MVLNRLSCHDDDEKSMPVEVGGVRELWESFSFV